MKSHIFRSLACIAFTFLLVPCASAGDVSLHALTIKHQTANSSDLFILDIVIKNNTAAAIPISKFYIDRIYCDDLETYKEAAYAATPSIGPGQSHQVSLYFPPEQEQSLRLSYTSGRGQQSYVEMMVPRADYDAKGAALYRCKPDKAKVTPALKAPVKKLKTITPKL